MGDQQRSITPGCLPEISVACFGFIVWAVLRGGRMDPNALERGKLDAEARSDPSVNLVGRGTPPPGF